MLFPFLLTAETAENAEEQRKTAEGEIEKGQSKKPLPFSAFPLHPLRSLR